MLYKDKIGKYIIEAKIYDEPSPYGIQDGRISKLWIWDETKPNLVYCYDRGDESKGEGFNETVEEIIKMLISQFAK